MILRMRLELRPRSRASNGLPRAVPAFARAIGSLLTVVSRASNRVHEQLDHRSLHDLAALVPRFAPHRDRPALAPGARGHDYHDFTFDVEHIGRPRGGWPG